MPVSQEKDTLMVKYFRFFILRKPKILGKIRIQKMCQISGHSSAVAEAAKCYETFLWQGIKGTECVCNSDWCNSAFRHHLSTPKFFYFLSFFVFAVVRLQ